MIIICKEKNWEIILIIYLFHYYKKRKWFQTKLVPWLKLGILLVIPLALFNHEQDADLTCICVRCLMAAARSCPTSTRQLTHCTDRRDWLLPLTDTLWSQIPETTALKSTATCSSGSSPSAQQTAHPEGSHTLTCTSGCRITLADFALVHPPVSPRIVPSSCHLFDSPPHVCLLHHFRKLNQKWSYESWFLWSVLCPCSDILMNCFIGVSHPVHIPLQHQSSSVIQKYFAPNYCWIWRPGCFNVGCSVLEMWNVKKDVCLLWKVLFKGSLPNHTKLHCSLDGNVHHFLTDQRLIFQQVVKCEHK